MDWTLLYPVGAGIVRNLQGWVSSTDFSDGISSFEWKKLITTTVEVTVLGFATLWALPVDAATASAIALLISYGVSNFRKILQPKN